MTIREYSGSIFAEVKFRISDARKVFGLMKVFGCRVMRMNVKRRLYGEVTVLYQQHYIEAQTWSMEGAQENQYP